MCFKIEEHLNILNSAFILLVLKIIKVNQKSKLAAKQCFSSGSQATYIVFHHTEDIEILLKLPSS